jgi:predicted ester cyclase
MIRVRHALSLALLLAACGGSQDTKPTTPEVGTEHETTSTAEPVGSGQPTDPKPAEPPPAPKKLTTEELVKAHDACYASWLAKDEKAMAACYGPDSTEEMVDSGMPSTRGAEQSLEHSRVLWKAFPDVSGGTTANIASGNNLVHLGILTGTNTGEMMGQKASGKKMGIAFAEVIEMTDDGKHGAVRLYLDHGTMAGQLGWSKQKVRAFMDKPAGAPAVAIGTDSEAEQKNVAAVTAGFEAFNKKDWKGLEAAYAADAVLSDQTMPADVKGAKKISKALQEIGKAFSDGKSSPGKIWGAGDYVVAETTFTGTNDGQWKAMGIKKKTGKPVTLRSVHVFRMEGGKVKEHWLFGNGMAMAMQLGLMQPPGHAGDKPAGDKPMEKKQ